MRMRAGVYMAWMSEMCPVSKDGRDRGQARKRTHADNHTAKREDGCSSVEGSKHYHRRLQTRDEAQLGDLDCSHPRRQLLPKSSPGFHPETHLNEQVQQT